MKAIKNNRFLSFCIVATALLCSCSREPVESFAGGDPTSPILPDAGVAATVETKADLSGAVSGTAFPANTTKVFSVVGYKGTAAPTNNWSSPYINGVIVNSGTSSTLSFAPSQYYPANGDKVFFYAYSPVSGTYTAGNGTTTPKVAWTITGMQDIMAAQVTTGIGKVSSGTQTQPTFAFTHKLKQVKFKVVKDASFEDNIKLTSLKIIGAKTAATMDLSTGAVSWGSTTGDLTVYNNTTGQALTTTAASVGSAMMFEPGASFMVQAIAGGKTYNATVTLIGTGAGTAGCSHEVTLCFKRSTITPTATISDWTATSTACLATLPVATTMLEVTGITLNASSSHTAPRAGGPMTIVAQTNIPPTSNIAWVVKDDNGDLVAQSVSYSDYNTATLTLDANNSWHSIPLELYYSYEGSEPILFSGDYTQSGYTISDFRLTTGQWNNNDKQTHVYAGIRNVTVAGDYPSGQQYNLKDETGTVLGPFTASTSGSITLPQNSYGSTIRWELVPIVDADQPIDPLGLYIEQTANTQNGIDPSFVFVDGKLIYLNRTSLTRAEAMDYCSQRGSELPWNLTSDHAAIINKVYTLANGQSLWVRRYEQSKYWTVSYYQPNESFSNTSHNNADFKRPFVCMPYKLD